tara:strand:+ start:273 stop:1106 length:834 start_codon:yes stop_codon:yes gene_type:complete
MAVETDGSAIQGSSLENIDVGFYEYVDEVLNLHATSNGGFKKVPVTWLSSERAFQIKNNVTLRDSGGHLKLPLITVNRGSIIKDPSFKGSYQANNQLPSTGPRGYKNNSYLAGRKLKQVKSSEFMENDLNEDTLGVNNNGYTTRKKLVYEEVYLPIPVYVSISYSINIRTEYQQQMNQLLVPFIARTGQINSFIFEKNGYRYEAFIQQDFGQENNANNFGEDERFFVTKIDVKVLGYVHGEGVNNSKPIVVTKENIVEVKLVGERLVKNISDDKNFV